MCSIGEVEKTTSLFYAEKQEENNMKYRNKNYKEDWKGNL